MPGRHPDDDLLADLAADVLPADRARAVEAHVLACDRCAGLLEDAERVRSLLLSGDPGPVPVDVWHRIEAALAAEAAPAHGSPTGPERAGDTAAFQAFVDAPTAPRRVVPPASADSLPADAPDDDGAGWAEDDDPLDDPLRWGRRPVPSGPPVTSGRAVTSGGSGSGGSRRDARAGAGRRGPLLLAAAAVLAVVAVTGSVKLLGRGGSSEATLSAGTAQSSKSAAGDAGASTSPAPIVRSGRDYRGPTLGAQASALLAGTTGAAGAATTGRSGGGVPSPEAAAPGLSRSPAAAVPPDPTANDITNPTRLAACLDALGVARDRLVAVDLATYEGREAAILLLNAAEGTGHEVWAVERTCAPGAEGALKYTHSSD
jgi:hypothetical protein